MSNCKINNSINYGYNYYYYYYYLTIIMQNNK